MDIRVVRTIDEFGLSVTLRFGAGDYDVFNGDDPATVGLFHDIEGPAADGRKVSVRLSDFSKFAELVEGAQASAIPGTVGDPIPKPPAP